MQDEDELKIELGEGEEILAEGDKNKVMCTCYTLLFSVAEIVLLYESAIASSGYIRLIFASAAVALPFATIHLLESFKYNQIYLTDKRIIITQKDNIEGIPFDEVKEFAGTDSIYLKSRRHFTFAYTNLDYVKERFSEIYPVYKQAFHIGKLFSVLVFVILLLLIFGMKSTRQYLYDLKQDYTLRKQQSQTVIVNEKDYMLYLERTLKLYWNPPETNNDANAVVEFTIMNDGTIQNEKIKKSSGSREIDNSALFAVKRANPLKKLPQDLMNKNGVKINFSFDYNTQK